MAPSPPWGPQPLPARRHFPAGLSLVAVTWGGDGAVALGSAAEHGMAAAGRGPANPSLGWWEDDAHPLRGGPAHCGGLQLELVPGHCLCPPQVGGLRVPRLPGPPARLREGRVPPLERVGRQPAPHPVRAPCAGHAVAPAGLLREQLKDTPAPRCPRCRVGADMMPPAEAVTLVVFLCKKTQ